MFHAQKCHYVTFVKFRSNYQDIQDFRDFETLNSTHLDKFFFNLSMRNLTQVQIKYFIRVKFKKKLGPSTAGLPISGSSRSEIYRPRLLLIGSYLDGNFPLPVGIKMVIRQVINMFYERRKRLVWFFVIFIDFFADFVLFMIFF